MDNGTNEDQLLLQYLFLPCDVIQCAALAVWLIGDLKLRIKPNEAVGGARVEFLDLASGGH